MATIFVRVLSEGEWFGAWAPVEAVAKDEAERVFVILENELTEDDEYEFFEPGTEVRVVEFRDEHGEAFWGAVESTGSSLIISSEK